MRELEISASTHNLPTAAELGATYQYFTNFLAEAGYKGYQYAYARRLTAGGLHVPKQLALHGHITSLHQSFAGYRTAELPFRFFLGTLESSQRKLETVQIAAGQKLPLIVHPNEQWLDNKEPDRHRNLNYRYLQQSRRFGALLFQPTVELLKKWNIENDGDPLDTALHIKQILQGEVGSGLNRGFSGIALDTHHLVSKRAGEQFSTEQACLLAGGLAEIGALRSPSELQLSFRPDWDDASDNLEQTLAGNFAHTPHGRIVQAIANALPPEQKNLRITVEVKASAFKKRVGGYRAGNKQLVALLRASDLAG